MANALLHMPELEGMELNHVQALIKEFSDKQAFQFAGMYRARRRDPNMILITTLIGFLGVAGIQRFLVGQIGMGILYLLTAGLCFIGTIVDAINYKSIAFEYNSKIAAELAAATLSLNQYQVD